MDLTGFEPAPATLTGCCASVTPQAHACNGNDETCELHVQPSHPGARIPKMVLASRFRRRLHHPARASAPVTTRLQIHILLHLHRMGWIDGRLGTRFTHLAEAAGLGVERLPTSLGFVGYLGQEIADRTTVEVIGRIEVLSTA